MATILIEREDDADGVRFYWSLVQDDGSILAASARHWESPSEAEDIARAEAGAISVSVSAVKNIPVRIE